MNAIWIDGKLCDGEQAKISVLDHGLLYGDGVFEGIRCVERRVVDLDLHLQRLERSARAIALQVPERAELERAVLSTCAARAELDAYVRLIVTRGVGALGIDVATCESPTLICIAGQLSLYNPQGAGLELVTVSLRRPSADVLDPRVKSLNYLNNVLAKMEAKRHGGDEALVLNQRGTIAEASGANVFAEFEGVLCTPPTADGALGGLTRRRVLRLAADAGIATQQRSLTRYDLLEANEVFLTGTGAGIVPAHKLDGIELGASRRLGDELRRRAAEYARQFGTPVPAAVAA
jgi:branched-chain amino acid aminotransferase